MSFSIDLEKQKGLPTTNKTGIKPAGIQNKEMFQVFRLQTQSRYQFDETCRE